MDLDEFVSKALEHIIKGVSDAQQYAIDNNARINPVETLNTGGAKVIDGSREPIKNYITENIEFDIAVTAIKGTETKGSIGVVTGILNLGSGGQSNAEEQIVNRIKFTVPVQLPEQDEKPKR